MNNESCCCGSQPVLEVSEFDLGLLLSLSQRQLNIYDVYMSYRNERGGCVTRASEWAGRARVRRSDARARRLRGEERGRDA